MRLNPAIRPSSPPMELEEIAAEEEDMQGLKEEEMEAILAKVVAGAKEQAQEQTAESEDKTDTDTGSSVDGEDDDSLYEYAGSIDELDYPKVWQQ